MPIDWRRFCRRRKRKSKLSLPSVELLFKGWLCSWITVGFSKAVNFACKNFSRSNKRAKANAAAALLRDLQLQVLQ